MDLRQTNYSFHYSERLKSGLFLIFNTLDRLVGLEGERLEGGKEVARGVWAGLRSELKLAKQYLPAEKVILIETKLLEAGGEVEFHNYIKARERLAEALSQVTTLSDRYMEKLKQENWI